MPIYRDEILPLADVCVPNQFEAQLLSGCSISNEAEAIKAMKVLHSKGVKIVILSSADFATSTKEESICLASQRLEDGTFETARIAFPTLPVHFVGTVEVRPLKLLLMMMDLCKIFQLHSLKFNNLNVVQASTRKVPLAGTSLKLKKGRRARHRYDSERSLFAFADIDPEDAPEGWDILEENTSHFRSLLDNQILLEQFLDNEDIHDASYDQVGKAANVKCEKNQNRDPESSFLRISSHLRQALKKHFPMGMLAGLEEQIIGHFLANPDECFVTSGLSSYERLLAHTCCMYNHLISESFDDNGVRKLKVVNPNGNHFEPVDPDLVKYLTIRNNFK
jgi:hypothetical protein